MTLRRGLAKHLVSSGRLGAAGSVFDRSVDLSIPRWEVYGSLTTGDAYTDNGMVPALPNLDTHLLRVLVLVVVVVRVIMEGMVVVVVVVVVVLPSSSSCPRRHRGIIAAPTQQDRQLALLGGCFVFIKSPEMIMWALEARAEG